MNDKQQKLALELTKKMADDGKLIEAGFAAMHMLALQNMSTAQINDMRIAYMAGAEHLFRSIIAILDTGTEPTARDLNRMELIEIELTRWRETLANYIEGGKKWT